MGGGGGCLWESRGGAAGEHQGGRGGGRRWESRWGAAGGYLGGEETATPCPTDAWRGGAGTKSPPTHPPPPPHTRVRQRVIVSFARARDGSRRAVPHRIRPRSCSRPAFATAPARAPFSPTPFPTAGTVINPPRARHSPVPTGSRAISPPTMRHAKDWACSDHRGYDDDYWTPPPSPGVACHWTCKCPYAATPPPYSDFWGGGRAFTEGPAGWRGGSGPGETGDGGWGPRPGWRCYGGGGGAPREPLYNSGRGRPSQPFLNQQLY